jgi:hypothetical protein
VGTEEPEIMASSSAFKLPICVATPAASVALRKRRRFTGASFPQ